MEFPGNSKNVTNEPKPEKPKKDIQKVVSTDVVQRKKPVRKRLKELFFSGEFKGAVSFIVGAVLLPALKNMVVDATSKGVERVVYGEGAARRRPELGRPRVSYNSPVDRYSRRAMLPDQPPAPQRRQDVGEIILVSRDEAELVIERLRDVLDTYEVASIADLHDLVGLPTTYVDNKWGWTELKYAEVRQVREGYLLDLPTVEPIA